MADLNPYHQFTGLRDLARLGLWEQAKFHGAELYDDFCIYRDNDGLYFSCQVQKRTISCNMDDYTEIQRALLWVFE